jgi:hypothetical protein
MNTKMFAKQRVVIYDYAAHVGQKLHCQLIEVKGGSCFKVTVNVDTSYPSQGETFLYVFISNVGFSILLHQSWDESKCNAWWHALDAPVQGTVVRSGQHLEVLRKSAADLVDLGVMIMALGQEEKS